MSGRWQEYILEDNGLDRLEIDWPEAGGASERLLPRMLLSLRRAGSLSREEHAPNTARRAWLARQGFDYRQTLSLPLIHSQLVHFARTPEDLTGLQGDAIVSDNPTAHIVLTVADCMPIYIYDPQSGAFALLHSGWQGTGILEAACHTFVQHFDSDPQNLMVVFGPHIGSCCYTVDQARARLFADRFGAAAVKKQDDGYSLDLLEANLVLADTLKIGRLAYTRTCTRCNGFLGSFRREGAEGFTRMAALIGFPADGAVNA